MVSRSSRGRRGSSVKSSHSDSIPGYARRLPVMAPKKAPGKITTISQPVMTNIHGVQIPLDLKVSDFLIWKKRNDEICKGTEY